RRLAEAPHRQEATLESLDRRSKKPLDLEIQVMKWTIEEAGQPLTDRGLADTADAGEEDPHVLAFDDGLAFGGSRIRSRFACRRLALLATLALGRDRQSPEPQKMRIAAPIPSGRGPLSRDAGEERIMPPTDANLT